MKTRLVEGVEVHRGSGNVFADLGLADASQYHAGVRAGLKTMPLTRQQRGFFPYKRMVFLWLNATVRHDRSQI